MIRTERKDSRVALIVASLSLELILALQIFWSLLVMDWV